MSRSNQRDRVESAYEDESCTSLQGNTPLLIEEDANQGKTKRKVNLLNLILISVIFLLQNASFSIYFESNLNIWRSEDLDKWWFISKCSFIGCYLFSCLLAPYICKEILSIKHCLLLGSISTSAFILAQMIPFSYTLIPAAVILGLLLPLQFVAQGIWHTDNSRMYSTSPSGTHLTNLNQDYSITMFHAVFYCLYLFGPVLRNSFKLLLSDNHYLDDKHVSLYDDDESTSKCNFRESSAQLLQYNNITKESTRIFRIEAIMGCYLTSSLVAVLFIVFCFTSPLFTPDSKSKGRQDLYQKVLPGIELSLLLTCLGFSLGVEQYILYNVIPQVMICKVFHENQDLHLVLIIAVAAVSSFQALFQACFTKHLGRCRLLMTSSIIIVAVSITLLVLRSDQLQVGVIFVLGTVWATADTTWQVQFSALLSVRFYQRKERAFSCLRFWQMCGLSLSYFLHYFHRSSYIIYVCLALVITTVIIYLVSEIRRRLQEQETRGIQTSQYKLQEVASASWIPKLNPLKQGERAQLINFPRH